MTDLTDQQIDEMLQRVKRWSWPRQYGKSVIVDLVNAIPSLLAAKKEAVARAQKAEDERDELRRDRDHQRRKAEDFEGRYETAHDSRMHAEDCYRRELKRADALAARLADYENGISWGTTCTSCARVLDKSYEEYVRADKAEAKLAEVAEHHHEDAGCCVSCVDEYDNPQSWPCPTAEALAADTTPEPTE